MSAQARTLSKRWPVWLLSALLILTSVFVSSPARAAVNQLDSRVFDWRFYVNNYADLLQNGIDTKQEAESHWLNRGIIEGRQAHPGFHTRQYLSIYADVRQAYGASNFAGAIEHYLLYGYNEGRIGYVVGGAYDRWTIRNDRIYVSASRRTAGAVDSIFFGGREFLNSYDHGRQLQVALTKNNWSECFNPTEAGSRADSIGGTSTSSGLLVRATTNNLATQVNPAFWLQPGQTSENCPPKGKTSPKNAVNTTTVSTYRFNTDVTVGIPNFPNTILFKTQVTFPEAVTSSVIEAPAGYMAGDFDAFYSYDPSTTAAPVRFYPPAQSPQEQKLPVILATQDGNYAIGGWSPDLPQTNVEGNDFSNFAYAYGYFPSPAPAQATTKWRATFRTGAMSANMSRSYRVFIAVGSLTTVQSTLHQLYVNRASLPQ